MSVTEAELADYWVAVSASNARAAYDVAHGLLARGASMEIVLSGLVVATQRRVGREWACNGLSVAQEHAATAISEHVVRRLAADQPAPTEGPVLIVACVEREWHALPGLIVAETLRSWGSRVDYLGADTSRDVLVSRILDVGPRAVLLSASLSSSLTRVRRQIEAVRGTGTPVVVGGRAFDRAGTRARRLGASAYAEGPREALDALATLPRQVPGPVALRHPGAAEALSIQGNCESLARAVIGAQDNHLDLQMGAGRAASLDDWRVVLTWSVPHLIDSVAGALLTEDDSVIEEVRQWLASVLAFRGAPADAPEAVWASLREELRHYPEATRLLDPSR